MEIKIDLKIFIFAFIFILTKQIKIYALLMFFALIHEIGHLIAGLILGLKPGTLKIAPYGFSIGFKTKIDDYNKKIKCSTMLSLKKIIIASAGPITNLLVIIIIYIYYIIAKENIIFYNNLDVIIYSNLLIFIFNLIPIYPLDGGRIVKEIININFGVKKSYLYTYKISNISIIILTILSSFLVLIYKNIAIIIIIVYLWFLVIMQSKRLALFKNFR